MANEVFFKIVIPNYNSMAYIKKCLDSILSQTFKSFKVIIVDDKSTDMSDKLCESYSHQFQDKIVFLRNTEKKFAGGSRNVGLAYAIKSEYTWVIDADDKLFDNNALQIAYDNLKTLEYDMLVFNAVTSHCGVCKDYHQYIFSIYDDYQLTNSPIRVPWCKIIKSSKIVPFLEESLFGEDAYQHVAQLDNIKTFKQIDDVLYQYNINNTSLTHNASRLNERSKHKNVFVDALKQLFHDVKNTHVKSSICNRLVFEKSSVNDVVFKTTSKKNRILVMTAGSKNLEYQYSKTNKNKQLYCDLHDVTYTFIPLPDDKKKAYHARKDLLADAIKSGKYDWVIWMDCDAWFNNFELDINDLINNMTDASTHLVVATDHPVAKKNDVQHFHDCYINSGVLIFRASDVSLSMIDTWKHPDNNAMTWMKHNTKFNDQPFLSIRILWDNLFKLHTQVVSHEILNTFANYCVNKDAFIIHAAGHNGQYEFNKYCTQFKIKT